MLNPANPIWGMVGIAFTAIGAIAAIFGVIFAFSQLIQTRKQLTCVLRSVHPLITGIDFFKDVEVRVDGHTVKNASVIFLVMQNSGRASIKPNDYERPISINFTGAKVLRASTVFSIPSNLGEIIESVKETTIVLKKALLNRKDRIDLMVILGDIDPQTFDIYVDARIEGVKEVKQGDYQPSLGDGLDDFFINMGFDLKTTDPFDVLSRKFAERSQHKKNPNEHVKKVE